MKTLKKILYVMVVIMTTALLLKGCQKDPITLYPNEYNVYTNGKGGIGSAGGIVMVDDENSPLHGVAVEIPEGALDSMVEISIKLAPDSIKLPGDENAVVISFLPSGLKFKKPVGIHLPIAEELDTTNLFGWHINYEEMVIKQIPCDISENQATFLTEHFSYYTLSNKGIRLYKEMYYYNTSIGKRVTANVWVEGPIENTNNWGYSGIPVLNNNLSINNALEVVEHHSLQNVRSSFTAQLKRYGLGGIINPTVGYEYSLRVRTFVNHGYAKEINVNPDGFQGPYNFVPNFTIYSAEDKELYFGGRAICFHWYEELENDKSYFVEVKYILQSYGKNWTYTHEFNTKSGRLKPSEMIQSNPDPNSRFFMSSPPTPETKPTVTTANVTNITQTSATGGGNVTSSGNSTVTGRGLTWISSENLFNHVSHDYIKAQELSSNKIDGSNNANNQLSTGSIILYKTSENRYGKFRVVSYGYDLVIQWVTYNANGSVHSSGNYLTIRGTFNAELDNGNEALTNNYIDFHWNMHTSELRYLIPRNGAQFKVLTEYENAPSLSVNDGTTSSGSGTGAFTSNITGLTANTPYFLKAYATNNSGTGLGQIVRFLTQQNLNQIPVANFSGSPTSGTAPLTVSFTDMSTNTPTSWFWNFGDGNSSTQRNPTNIYNSAGTYTVSLTATNSHGSHTETKTNYIQVSTAGGAPTANFSASPTSGTAPLSVSFTDQSINSPTSWQWTFGDGNSSTQQNPSHTYNTPGNYTVSLTVSNAHGSDSETKNNYINVSDGGGNGDDTEVVEVLNPATGKTWMDRNLGASRAATSSTDAEAYGDLYQWGRAADGHQIRTSGTTSTLSNSDIPGHGNFILAPNNPWDWRSPQNDNLWQGINGTNNPCPAGYRLPTEAELNAERLSWSSNDAAGAFASHLKLPVAGYRLYSNGSLIDVGSYGSLWSSTVVGTRSHNLAFVSSAAGMLSNIRALGHSVRCLKD